MKLPFPKYHKCDAQNDALSILGKACANLASNFVSAVNVDDLQARALGTVRARLKDQLSTQLDEIDEIVEKLSTGKSPAQRTTKKKSRRSSTAGSLFD